ncbi:hypothetical protein TNIN_495931 [Trichonephila inaurata madagascariensis]|uniref:Uncharacterized protein n=1 Tax=Trichonephila inaurata madagascariensis TaxID=2747483 RepID=A0A8X7CKT7_9ARAC|nr:hypothetical protein TNIN_495931 [Trichonephila inaurata madagascariensis]
MHFPVLHLSISNSILRLQTMPQPPQLNVTIESITKFNLNQLCSWWPSKTSDPEHRHVNAGFDTSRAYYLATVSTQLISEQV